ncbi:MAG: TonB family protein [Opitutaceae bacterium]|nr:TonB family protein [Opitutaceae bacterium]
MHDDDARDLQRFANDGDEAAFAAVVQRHLGLVYSAALRQVNGDAHLAHDVAQSVFTDLARKAGEVAARGAPLPGWLYTSTHYAAAKAVRAEQRRRRREQEAHAMEELHSDDSHDAAWAQLRPHLDAMMQRLDRSDREAILQRFFAGRNFPEMAAALGVTESGARMRVDRALEKLRVLLEGRGIRSSAAVLGGVLATEALAAPPAGLAAAITSTALAQAGGAAAAGALGLFGMTKIQTIILATAAAGGLAVVGVEMRAPRQVRAELAAVATPPAVEQPADRAGGADTNPARALPEIGDDAVARLRAEKARLQARLQGAPPPLVQVASAPPAARPSADAKSASGPVFDMKELDVTPQPIERKPPAYPFALKALGVPGEVMVSFVVTGSGDVADLRVEDTSHPAFGEVALQAVAQWKFAPGQKDGVPVNVRLRQPLKFALHTEEWF